MLSPQGESNPFNLFRDTYHLFNLFSTPEWRDFLKCTVALMFMESSFLDGMSSELVLGNKVITPLLEKFNVRIIPQGTQ